MTDKSMRTLVRLRDTDQTVADPDQDIRGRDVFDSGGEKVGTVEDLLIDPQENAVRMLRVEHGGILGFGATSSFIPVEAVSAVEADRVRIDQSRARISDAPRYDPELVDQPDYYLGLYDYYGYAPYWTATSAPAPHWAAMLGRPKH
ncbi:PRC-barrel domain-containing protein [Actinoplanes sp. NPDC051411]|uniref:PRC-barrel domain-containing protein n=1 Tax=Actinoplanes sp. NPDC051411 TaxID=3155522 RepID=UPI00342FC94D